MNLEDILVFKAAVKEYEYSGAKIQLKTARTFHLAGVTVVQQNTTEEIFIKKNRSHKSAAFLYLIGIWMICF